MRLEDKLGMVTAAGSGMGRAGAIRFAKEGAAVGVVDIDHAAVVPSELSPISPRMKIRGASCARQRMLSEVSISCGTMWAIQSRPRSRGSR